MIVVVAQDRVDTDRWSAHYRRGETMTDDIADFANQIIKNNLTAYAMIRVSDNDTRQTFQNRTIQRLKLDPSEFTLKGEVKE